MKLKVTEFVGNQLVLSGSQDGRAAALKLAEKAAVNDDALLILDFDKVRVATASFLREAVLGLRQLLADPPRLVAVTKCTPTIIEEFSVLLAARRECLASIDFRQAGKPAIRVLGPLDARLQTCFALLSNKGEATAPELAALSPKDDIGVTGWNNRLATLAEVGLAVAVKNGRTKVYTTFTGVIGHGT